MTKEDTRRYSLDQIISMNERREFRPATTETPAFDLDEDFWKSAKRVSDGTERTTVILEVSSDAVEQFKKAGPNYLQRMAEVIDEAAKKVS